jgi:Flp pilus assembly pilin Flp
MKFKCSENGAVAVEFALIAIFLLTLIFGAIDFGLLFYNKQVLTNATREGARKGLVQKLQPRDIDAERVNVIDTVLEYCQQNLVTGGSDPTNALKQPQVNYENKFGDPISTLNDPDLVGGSIIVETEYTYDFFVISYLGIGPKGIIAEVKMTME